MSQDIKAANETLATELTRQRLRHEREVSELKQQLAKALDERNAEHASNVCHALLDHLVLKFLVCLRILNPHKAVRERSSAHVCSESSQFVLYTFAGPKEGGEGKGACRQGGCHSQAEPASCGFTAAVSYLLGIAAKLLRHIACSLSYSSLLAYSRLQHFHSLHVA